MKKMVQKFIIAGIIVMLCGTVGADAQNRRTAGGSNQQTTSTASKSTSKSSSNSTSYSRTGGTKSSSTATKSSSREEVGRSSANSQSQARRVDPQVKRDAKVSSRQLERDADRIERAKRDYRPAPKHYGAFSRPYIERDYRPAPYHIVGHHNFGYRIHSLPRGYEIRYVKSVPYYFYDGIYYRTYRGGGYVVVRPPVGSYITSRMLDVALTAVVLNSIENTYERIIEAQQSKNAKYYYGDGIYYRYDNDRYEVIDAPVGALISRLPEDYEEISLNGTTYYQVEDVLYKVAIVDGYPFFEVAAIL